MRVDLGFVFGMIGGCLMQRPQRSDGYCCERGSSAWSRDRKVDTKWKQKRGAFEIE